MKKLLVLILLLVSVITFGQNKEQRLRKTSSNVNSKERAMINNGLDQTYVNEDSITAQAIDFTTGELNVTGDLSVGGTINPYPDEIDLSDYFITPANGNVWNFATNTSNITIEAAKWNRLFYSIDTLYISGGASPFGWDYKFRWINSSGNTPAALIAGEYNSFRSNNLKAASLTSHSLASYLYPNANDTVRIGTVVGANIHVNSYTSAATGRIEVGEEVILDVIGTFDNYMVVDSVSGLRFTLEDKGINADSIGKVFVIKNMDEGLRGVDATYFLYSEYGDIYSNGDLQFTGAVTQTQLTGSLTDGAPTDAQIDTITGTTPAVVGAGWSVTILDSDGSGLLYRIESDGTNWQYQVLAIAT